MEQNATIISTIYYFIIKIWECDSCSSTVDRVTTCDTNYYWTSCLQNKSAVFNHILTHVTVFSSMST